MSDYVIVQYIYIYIYSFVCVYIYIYRERESDCVVYNVFAICLGQLGKSQTVLMPDLGDP